MRKRLIELLKEADIRICGRYANYDEAKEMLAGILLAEGVIVLPFKVGDTMYTIDGDQVKEWKAVLVGYDFYCGKVEMHLATEHYEELIVLRNFELHKTVFPTLEEAEKALAEGGK